MAIATNSSTKVTAFCFNETSICAFIMAESAVFDVDYYRKLYGDAEKVLRIEVRLKKELCEYFNIAYYIFAFKFNSIFELVDNNIYIIIIINGSRVIVKLTSEI